MRPDKMNLASLGNMTPHVHWHVIPRFATTAISPPRSGPRRSASRRPRARRRAPRRLAAAIAARLGA
jgi:diadenosine tetraphosphate (Ap4A) HIT family hydrolase